VMRLLLGLVVVALFAVVLWFLFASEGGLVLLRFGAAKCLGSGMVWLRFFVLLRAWVLVLVLNIAGLRCRLKAWDQSNDRWYCVYVLW
ncbi:hypothetical protein U1Q18_010139, partial [Sarracenia purpurea var. burkii]